MDFLGFLGDVVNFVLCPDALRPALVASFGCESKRGALMWVSRQERMILSDPEWSFPTLRGTLFRSGLDGLCIVSRDAVARYISPLLPPSAFMNFGAFRALVRWGKFARTPLTRIGLTR